MRTSKTQFQAFETDRNLRFDTQELALTWQTQPALGFDIGRVNLRNGVASGFNPTDWFKANSLALNDSADPVDRRLNRLGTLMFAGSAGLGASLVTFGYRPRIQAQGEDFMAARPVVGLGLDRTTPSAAFF